MVSHSHSGMPLHIQTALTREASETERGRKRRRKSEEEEEEGVRSRRQARKYRVNRNDGQAYGMQLLESKRLKNRRIEMHASATRRLLCGRARARRDHADVSPSCDKMKDYHRMSRSRGGVIRGYIIN